MAGENLIKRRHPRYLASKAKWDFYYDSYVGGENYITEKNLFRYYKEGVEEFKLRKQRAYRENHSKRVVDLINSYLFKAQPVRDAQANKVVEDFIENTDGKGRSMSSYMKEVSQFASVFGRVYIVVDRMALDEDDQTGTAADNLKAKPYCWTLFPQDMLDMAFDDDGDMKWALVHELKRDDHDPFTSTGIMESRFRLWTKDSWFLFDKDGNQTETANHGLGMVPIVPVNNENLNEYEGLSLINDLAYVDRAIFNNWSRLDTIVNDQTFSQLIFPVESLLVEEIVTDPVLREKFLTMATNRILFYSATSTAKPEFISPDASQASFILGMIEKQIKQLYSVLGLSGEVTQETKVASSGISKAYDFQKLNKLLANKADNLEEAEERIYDVFKAWMGNMKAEVVIEYPEDFDVKNLADEIAEAQQLMLLQISETFKKEIDKQVVLKALPKAEQDVMEKIMKEIEDGNQADILAANDGTQRFGFDKGGVAPAKPLDFSKVQQNEAP